MGVDEKRHGEEIGRPAWTEPAGNEALVHRSRALSPAGPADAALVEELSGRAARKAKTGQAAAMQQIGVFEGSDEGEACFDARGFARRRGRRAPPFCKAGRPTS